MAGILNRGKKFLRRCTHEIFVDRNWLGALRQVNGAGQGAMPFSKGVDVGGRSRSSDKVGDIDGVKIAWLQKACHRLKIDVVRIQEVRKLPAGCRNSGIGGPSRLRGL